MKQLTYPTKIFYLKKIEPRKYSLEDPLSGEPPVSLTDGNDTPVKPVELQVTTCEVASFDDVLNMKNLPGFDRYLPEELDSFVKESAAK